MKKLIIPIVLVFIQNVKSQQSNNNASLPNIVPPSPTAYSLGNYGNVPIGLFTGTANISIPLLTYKTNNISVPLNLFYCSNGIKVDEVSSNVGLGWNLNFGGVITRMVRDKADENATHIAFPDVINGPYNDPVTNQFLYTLGNGSDALDTEADQYSFNFGAYSGKFFFDQNNQPHIIDQQAIKIERIGNTNGEGQDFLLTVPTGEEYYFTEKERTTYRSSGSGHALPSSAITSWYLTKIRHPSGDEIYFKYDQGSISPYTISQSQTLKMSVGFPANQEFCADNGGTAKGRTLAPTAGIIVDNTVNFISKNITLITSNNPTNGTVAFEYESDSLNQDVPGNRKIKAIRMIDRNGEIVESPSFNYQNTINKRNFLSSVTFKDPQKKYSFQYESPELFPVRLSAMQDHWGYFNGEDANTALVPKDIPEYGFAKLNYGGANKAPNPAKAKTGMLKKITYPAKGFTELEYEGNTYWGEKTVYPDLYTKTLEIKTDNSKNNDQIEYLITSPTNQTIKIEAALFPNGVSGCGTINATGHYAGSVEVNQGTFYNLTRDDSFHNISINVTAGSTTKITLHTDFKCSKVRTDISYYPTAPDTFNTNMDTGGVRIRSTKDIDGSTGQSIYKRYYYAQKDNITKSSGYKGRDPYYVEEDKWQVQCGSGTPGGGCGGVVENSDLVLSSSSLISLYDTGIMSCLYPFVTISEGGNDFENGGEMKEYRIRKNDRGSSIWGPGKNSSTPWTNRDWDNGKELKSIILKRNSNSSVLDIIQTKENIYEKNDATTFELRNFVGRKLFTPACGNTISHPYTCTAADAIIPNSVCTGKEGMTVNLQDINNLDITEYRSISYWHYLKSQKITDYLNGVPVKTETEYFYDNPSHYQLNKQRNTLSDGTINETNFSYAHEKNNQYLIDKNMIGIPLETEVKKNGKIISKVQNLYPLSQADADGRTTGFPLPYSILSQDILSGTMSGEITYDKYDNKGNLLQYTTKEGIPVSIIWGYDQTKPIAQIEGIAYSWLQQNYPGDVKNVITSSNTDVNTQLNNDETVLLSALQKFRERLSIDRFRPRITTYTYDPLIGVRSITPPSGIRENYLYDFAGRLEKVIDANGRVVKEMKYNYKN